MADIDKTTGKVTCVSCLQSCISQTLTGTVSGDEVLQHGQSFLKVGEDGVFNNLTTFSTSFLRLGHQTTHARELTNLFLRTTGTRVKHHIDAVEALVVGTDGLHEDARKVVIDVRPHIDNLVVTLVIGDEAHVILVHNLLDLLIALGDEFFFLLGDDDVVEVK